MEQKTPTKTTTVITENLSASTNRFPEETKRKEDRKETLEKCNYFSDHYTSRPPLIPSFFPRFLSWLFHYRLPSMERFFEDMHILARLHKPNTRCISTPRTVCKIQNANFGHAANIASMLTFFIY